MPGPTTNPKILLTTAYRRSRNDYYDVVGANFVRTPRFAIPRTISSGLRFIKQNVPDIEIMEYPLWHEYTAKLAEGWDVVGFSFFQHDIGEALEMAAEARRQGIKEIWAGGYGALDPVAEEFADRVFYGYTEEQLLAEFFGRKLDRLLHPPLVWPLNINLPPAIPYKKLGIINTQRGCPYRCTFCQTPIHCPQPSRIPLESIEEILAYYRTVGINEIWIFDETFYTFPSHSEAVIDMLARYDMHWKPMTRADLCLEHLDSWADRGMVMASVGVESVNNEMLTKIGKRTNIELVQEFRRRTIEKKVFVLAYYMLGYEEDTYESILRDIEFIRENLWFDLFQLTVMTPYPRTPLWYDLESRYGIFEHDYHKFDARHLVWNHPNISPRQMDKLLRMVMAHLNIPMRNYVKGLIGLGQRRVRQKKFGFLWDDVARPFLHSLRYNERKQVSLPRLEKKP